MTRLILPLFLLGLAGLIFYSFTRPILAEIDTLRLEQDKLNTGLANAKKLREVEQSLLDTYNHFAPGSVERLNKFLPDNVDNVRLIIDINNLAKPYNMAIKNIRLRPEMEAEGANTPRGAVTLGFSVSGPYTNFKSFLADLARSLRLVDLATITFNAADKESYDYSMEIQTYWLK